MSFLFASNIFSIIFFNYLFISIFAYVLSMLSLCLCLDCIIPYCCVVVCGCEAAFVAEKSATEAERYLSPVSYMQFIVMFYFFLVHVQSEGFERCSYVDTFSES